jgi:hypothetical protein
MTSKDQVPKRRFQYSLRTLLLLFIPAVLFTALAKWLFCPPPIDVAITVQRFSWYKAFNGRTGLAAEVRITNRSTHTVWYLENPRYCAAQLVDGLWLESSISSPNAKEDWWTPQDGRGSITIHVGPIEEKATAMKIVVAFTTDRFMPKRHWVSSPEVRIVKKGKDLFPEVERGAESTQSLDAPTIFSRDREERE